MAFKQAQRKQARLRMAIDGPSGSGKTYTALAFAFALAERLTPGRRIAVIDTEHGSASKYAGEIMEQGDAPWDFDVEELHTYSPTEYTGKIEEAGRLGVGVLVVDSLSHAWEGKDGALELKDRQGGNSWAAWKDITPMHRRMVEAILTSPCHVICTMRSKTEWVTEEEVDSRTGKTKTVPKRIGIAPVQRSGMEYEFDIYGSMDLSHILTVSKTRCRAIDGAVIVKPGKTFINRVADWLESGVVAEIQPPPPRATDKQVQEIMDLLRASGLNVEREKKELVRRYAVQEFAELSGKQADEFLLLTRKRLQAQQVQQQAKQQSTPAPVPATHAPPTPANGSPATVAAPTAVPDETLAGISMYFGMLSDRNQMDVEKWRGPDWLGKYGVGITTAKALQAAQATDLLNRMIVAAMAGDAKPEPLTKEDAPGLFNTTGKEGQSQAAAPGGGTATDGGNQDLITALGEQQQAADRERERELAGVSVPGGS